jgi:hypothetical protein
MGSSHAMSFTYPKKIAQILGENDYIWRNLVKKNLVSLAEH